jgi:hypothetical protein
MAKAAMMDDGRHIIRFHAGMETAAGQSSRLKKGTAA